MIPKPRRLMQAMLSITLFIVLRGAVSFLLQVAIAARFGASVETDIYFVVIGLVLFLSEFMMAVLTFAVLPFLVRLRGEAGEDVAWQFGLAIVSSGSAILLSASLLLFLAAPVIIHLLAPGFSLEASQLAVALLRLCAVGFLLYALALLLGFVLQSYELFTSTTIVPMLPALFSILAIAALPRSWGVYNLVAGFLAGTAAALILQLWFWNRLRGSRSIKLQLAHPDLRQVRKLILPVAVTYLCSSLLPIIQRMWASGMAEGNVSAFGYASQIIAIPTAVLIMPMATILLPRFSASIQHGNFASVSKIVYETLVVVIITCTLAGALIAGLAAPLVSLLLERGSFTSADVALTASALRYLSIGLFGVAGSNILGRTFYAGGKVGQPLVAWLATCVFLALLDPLLARSLQVAGLALAYSLAYILNLGVLFVLLRAEFPGISILRVVGAVARLAICAFSTILVSEFVYASSVQWVVSMGLGASYSMALSIVLGGIVGTGAFMVAMVIMRGPEVRMLLKLTERAAGLRSGQRHSSVVEVQ